MLQIDSALFALREQLAQLIEGGHAHIRFADAVKDFPVAVAGKRPGNTPHSAWEMLEHMRIAIDDIVRFSGVYDGERTPDDTAPPKDYEEINWPEGYWPAASQSVSEEQWQQSAQAIANAQSAFVAHLRNEANDLFTPFPWGKGQTLLREALLIADHNAYHLGQLMLLRRMLE